MADADTASIGDAPAVRREFAGDGFRVREVAYRPGLRQAPHAHEYDGVTLVLAGGIRETVGRRDEVASPNGRESSSNASINSAAPAFKGATRSPT